MLPAAHRLTDGSVLRDTARRGRRAGSSTLVVHIADTPVPGSAALPDGELSADTDAATPSRAGFVVSRAVGGAVSRNRVRRRLRHLMRDRLSLLPPGSAVVVRARRGAGVASYAQLGADLDRCLRRGLRGEAGDQNRGPRGGRGQPAAPSGPGTPA